MHFLCGETHSTLESPRPSERPDSMHIVCLSWTGILYFDLNGTFDISTCPHDIHYLLYQECIKHLRTENPPSSVTCSLPVELLHSDLSRFSIPFGTLVNLLADRYAPSDINETPPEALCETFDHHSVIDFILSGILAVTSVSHGYHVACHLKEAQDDVPESDLYQALFLDIITLLWLYETVYRRASAADWSPMPWSKASLRELAVSDSIPEPTNYKTPTLNLHYLASADCSCTRHHGFGFGVPIDIPWFGAPHDDYPFCPTLSSYTKIRRNGVTQSLRDDAALWVSAMTFGLLEAVTCTRIPESMFLVPNDGDGLPVLSGARILRFLTGWHRRVHDYLHDINEHTGLEHGREVARLLQRALQAIDEEQWKNGSMFYRAGFSTEEVTDVGCAVALAVMPLCQIACHVWDMLPEMEDVLESVEDKQRTFYTAIVASCRKRMHQAGWCRNLVTEEFVSFWGIPRISHLIQLPPFIRNKPDEHRACTESACVFYTVTDTDAYVPRHVNPSCECEYTKPPFDDVVRMLSEGIIPAVVYDGTHFHVQPADDNTYVAISHVWADGLGSTTEIGLPTCQIARISGLVRQLDPESSGAFWMDSLCVPDVKDIRKRAIKYMGNTYRDAAKVLVIDECIRTQCSKSKALEENLFYIEMSGWVRRVWTLQEGVLARELYFEFTDGPVDVEMLMGLKGSSRTDTDVDDEDDPLVLLHVSHQACSHLPLVSVRYNLPNSRTGEKLPLDEVIRLLRLRSTTKAEDETIAISSLLPLDVDALLSITGPDTAERRVKECLMQVREVSKRLPMHSTPRMRLPGFSWAPRSLATAAETAHVEGSDSATCTEDGLLGQYLVAAFEEPVSIPEDCLPVRDLEDEFTIIITHPASASTYLLNVSVGLDISSVSFDVLLFLDKQLSTGTAPCVAARRSGTGPAKGECAPLRLEYIGAAGLDRTPLHEKRFGNERLVVMGELCEMDVLLT